MVLRAAGVLRGVKGDGVLVDMPQLAMSPLERSIRCWLTSGNYQVVSS